MPPLPNPRHERFAQSLFEGHTADEAYETAGFKANRGNASRLKANDNILARLTELQAQAAEDTTVTVESLLRELETARSQASSLNQLGAATQAIMGKAKLGGFLVQKIEQKIEVSDGFDRAESWEDIAAQMLEDFKAPFDEQDQERLLDLVRRFSEDVSELKDEITDRHEAVTLAHDPTERRSRQQHRARLRDRIRRGLRHGHGRQRLLTNGGG